MDFHEINSFFPVDFLNYYELFTKKYIKKKVTYTYIITTSYNTFACNVI